MRLFKNFMAWLRPATPVEQRDDVIAALAAEIGTTRGLLESTRSTVENLLKCQSSMFTMVGNLRRELTDLQIENGVLLTGLEAKEILPSGFHRSWSAAAKGRFDQAAEEKMESKRQEALLRAAVETAR